MAHSSTVTAGDTALASQYNNLRMDVLDPTTGHAHDGTDGKQLDWDTCWADPVHDHSTDAEGGNIACKEAPANDHTVSGLTITLTAGENLVFGEVCYLKSDGKMWKADADTIATGVTIGMAAESISADATGTFLLLGIARDDTWAWTVGGLIYLSTDAGAMTQTAPSGVDNVVQVLGVATHADRMYFNPQLVIIEHTG